MVGALVAAAVFERTMKSIVHREPFHRAEAGDYSFPSGGAMFSAVLLSALFLAAETPRQRRLALWVGAALMLGFGAALVVFGWHYPSDVLAGWCATAALIAAGWLIVHR